ncbi:putative ABC exporter domain-containing protein [Muricomes intestini]|uniref:putative ABC exporter domain-containing protein n=1 Tax=Muricomes intestini TaxID=1796634 RepID=UPI002FDF2436
MRALFYLTKQSLVNNVKRAVKKPITLLIMIGGIIYGVFVIVMLGQLVRTVKVDSVRGLLAIVTIWTIYMFFGNFASYSSRKGIIFRPAHAHFVFPAPISPKLILIHGAWMNYLLSIIVAIVFFIAGITVFQIEVWRMLLFFLTGCVLELLMEGSIMTYLYANDRISAENMKWVGRIIRAFLIGVSLLIILYFRRYGLTLESAWSFFDWPGLQMIPFVGWNISAYHLILLGPAPLNIVCTTLYLLSVAGMFAVARHMKCEGGYYEDAAKFADDYAEMKQQKKNGEMVTSVGKKKKKFRRVKEHYEATGAKAIFYRQLLEYKKEKYFIFSKMTLLTLFIAVFFSYMMKDSVTETGMPQMILLGIVGYMILITTGYLGKWENEIKSPYLFLVPDSPIKKLWYSTLMEHIKALADGCILCIILGTAWGIRPGQTAMAVLIYTVLQANRMYIKVVVQCLLGDSFGKTGQDIIRMLIQMMTLGLGIGAAVLVGTLINIDFVFPIILIYSIIVTVIIGLLASFRFYSMEQFA